MADFHRRDSFLKSAGTFGSFLDVNNLPKIPSGAFDLDYKIKETEAGRPDILAGNLYENPRLWWIFALRNPDVLRDPLEDFKAGVSIKIPSPEDVKALLG